MTVTLNCMFCRGLAIAGLLFTFSIVVLVLSGCGKTESTRSRDGSPTNTPTTSETTSKGANRASSERSHISRSDAGAVGGALDTTSPLDYVALGDSLAAGIGARRGYVSRYAEHLHIDTGARVRIHDLGIPGLTSSQLLHLLRNDTSMRRMLSGAEVVTFNIGLNDLGRARELYEEGSCGGPKNRRCLRATVERFEKSWDAIVAEILNLRSGDDTLIVTPGLGYTPHASAKFKLYVEEVSQHIGASANARGIPYAGVRLNAEGMSPDGLHPNDRGYGVIAGRLQKLGYKPLD